MDASATTPRPSTLAPYSRTRLNWTSSRSRSKPFRRIALTRFFRHTSEDMRELPDRSVHLMVTSPPYNVGKDYDEDLSMDDYRGLLSRVMAETFRVLVDGGRACVNIANLGRRPYIPIHSYIIEDAHEAGFFMRGEIIWNKAAGAGNSTAWGQLAVTIESGPAGHSRIHSRVSETAIQTNGPERARSDNLTRRFSGTYPQRLDVRT